jgi:hypothetical protein
MMRHIVARSFLVMLLLAGFRFCAPAQPGPPPPRPDRLAHDLRLTDQQADAIEQITSHLKSTLRRLEQTADSLRDLQQHAVRKAVRSADDSIATLLNNEQKEKFRALRDEWSGMPPMQQPDGRGCPPPPGAPGQHDLRESMPEPGAEMLPPPDPSGPPMDLDRLGHDLKLTEKQRTAIGKILDDAAAERGKQATGSRTEIMKKIEAQLTPEQKKIYSEMPRHDARSPGNDRRRPE